MKFGYARVSTTEQSLDLQIEALNSYGVDEIFTEKISGTITNRPELQKLRNKLRKGDTLVIYSLDRLGRTVNQLVNLAEEFDKEGINFVSLKENLDTHTASGKFSFHMFCAIAQMERDIISERTKAGLKAAKKRGKFGGRPPLDKKIVDTAIKMYYSDQFTIKEIQEATGIAKSTLYKYINIQKGEKK